MAAPPRRVSVELEPVGRRARVPPGATLLEAAQAVGVPVASVCGGHGTCGRCRVRIVHGAVGAPSPQERGELNPAELAQGVRLACQTAVESDVRIDIPPESLTVRQRLQLEGEEHAVALDPPVVILDVELAPPTRGDLRADATRLLDAVAPSAPTIGLAALTELPGRLRAGNWSTRIALHRSHNELVAVLGPGRSPLGLAVDVGTTKLAAYLVDLATGETLARAGTMNPQIAHGEDVLRRIAYAGGGAEARAALQHLAVDAVNRLAGDLSADAGRDRGEIVDCVVVGNTAMHHLFTGLPVRQLGQAPYVAATTDALELRAAEVGLHLSPGAALHLPPLIAGYVGADHVAMLLATGLAHTAATVLALDIGTNTEISLARAGRLWTCSTASGPAFEGAQISGGMRAAPGAIERVHYGDGRFQVQTVDDRPPVGLCGSGILDAVAQGLRAGIINTRGGLDGSHPLVAGGDGGAAYLVVPAADTGHHRDITVTRADVGEIQLAKAAIHAGTELLLAAAGVGVCDLDEIIVAGAFGTYLDVRSAVRVGLLPRAPEARFRQVGNAAGPGARRLLLSRDARRAAVELTRHVQYLELTTHPDFAGRFAEATRF